MTRNRSLPIRRAILAGGFAAAALVGPALGGLTLAGAPGAPLAACSDGEEADVFTATCTPFLVPNSPADNGFASGFSTNAANPDIPEIEGVPCVGGASAGACIGLAEDQAAAGPAAVPRSSISASP